MRAKRYCKLVRTLVRLILLHQIYAGGLFALLFADVTCLKCNQVTLFLSCPDAMHHFIRHELKIINMYRRIPPRAAVEAGEQP